jgi:aminoglycoside phosphotransferase (APT) family kinase protein
LLPTAFWKPLPRRSDESPHRSVLGPRLAEGRTAELFAWGPGRVIKLYRAEFSGPDADREAGLTQLARTAGLPVPEVVEVVEVEGRRGIVLERLAGPSLLARMFSRPWSVRGAARLVADLHAAMHTLTPSGPPVLKRRLEERIRRLQSLPEPLKASVLTTLAALPDGDALCHGDFHPMNIILSPRGPMIIDWVDVTVGPPLADVARTLLLISMGRPPGTFRRATVSALRALFRRAYLARYTTIRPFDGAELSAWMIPVAAARLAEAAPGERARLLALVHHNAAS